MRKRLFLLFPFAACFFLLVPVEGQHPVPPGVRDADKQSNSPIDPPAKFKQKPVDPTALKQEADELAKLSAAIPGQMDQISQGQMPKDLADQLKRIEKLVKHLRSEVAP